ncbi:MAG TPA: hypothetical protein PKM41_14365 [Deltaproteobacteria bacterium]|nr:hypothetical protein [Deltaproteobacteria bacterium]HOI08299.1 hypothetical protein [Deltaproteobacteria bacterium]
MKGQLATILVFIVFLAIPANSHAFYSLDEINEYLSYDRLKVVSVLDNKYAYHPWVEGRLINETNEAVYVSVRIYFCDVFRVKLNQITLSISMKPKEKVEFKQYLHKSEYESTRNAHHLEFEFIDLRVGGKRIGSRYDICG